MIDIVKLELPEMNDEVLTQTIKTLKQYKVKILAEKIETPELFNRCRELGCDMFQGYFLTPTNLVNIKFFFSNI